MKYIMNFKNHQPWIIPCALPCVGGNNPCAWYKKSYVSSKCTSNCYIRDHVRILRV